jgi:hypothetical protein
MPTSVVYSSNFAAVIASIPGLSTKLIEIPAKTHLVLITDLYEEGDVNSMLARAVSAQTVMAERRGRNISVLFRKPKDLPIVHVQVSILIGSSTAHWSRK